MVEMEAKKEQRKKEKRKKKCVSTYSGIDYCTENTNNLTCLHIL